MGEEDGTNRWRKLHPGRMAQWSGGLPDLVNHKILKAFGNVKSFPLKRIIIQFWRPVKIGEKRVLTCHGSPYAQPLLSNRLFKYRKRCCVFYYSIDDWGTEVDAPPMTITGAPPSSVYLNHFPEVVLDLRLHRGTPLVDLALECELTCFIMLPVFDETCCVGVIEVSMRLPADLVVIFNELRRELRIVGLSITPPLALRRRCKTITGDLNLARSEIGKALKVAVQSHPVTLGQVWIPIENYHCGMRRSLLFKLDHSVLSPGGVHLSTVKLFYRDFLLLPLKKGEGIVGRTLETHRPRLCRNIYKSSANQGLLGALSANTKCACFVICLRSSHTGELDYAFEFFWPRSSNHLALMEGLLLTLREYLPGFKYASGAQLGDELLVDVENSSSGTVKIFPGNKLSETRASVGMKRKSTRGKSELNQANQHPLTNINNLEGEDDDDDDDDDDLPIVAVYKVDYSLFFLPSSSTFKSFMEKIRQELELNPVKSYKIEYQVLPGECYSLTDDTSLKSCVSSYRTSENVDHVKLCVLEVDN